MKISYIVNIILSIAVIALIGIQIKAQKLDGMEVGSQAKNINTEELILNNITTRNSVRKYIDKPVEVEKIEKILRAGMAAPSAGNKQPWGFVVINDKEILNELGEVLPYASMTSKAPIAIAVCGNIEKGFEGKEGEYWIQDCSAVSENILLAAHSMGLGAVWTGVYPMEERMKDVTRILNLPENIVPLNIIPIGYPDGETPVKNKWNPSNIHYNKWQ